MSCECKIGCQIALLWNLTVSSTAALSRCQTKWRESMFSNVWIVFFFFFFFWGGGGGCCMLMTHSSGGCFNREYPSPKNSFAKELFLVAQSFWKFAEHDSDTVLCENFQRDWVTNIAVMDEHDFERIHDDVIKWKHFPRYLCAGNSPITGEFPSQRPVTRSFDVFSLIWAWTNGWINNRGAGDLRRHRAHYDVTIMWDEFGRDILHHNSPMIPGLQYAW